MGGPRVSGATLSWLADADRLSPWSEATVVVAGLGTSGYAAADGLMALGAGRIIVLDEADTPGNTDKADLLRAPDGEVTPGAGATTPGRAPTATRARRRAG